MTDQEIIQKVREEALKDCQFSRTGFVSSTLVPMLTKTEIESVLMFYAEVLALLSKWSLDDEVSTGCTED